MHHMCECVLCKYSLHLHDYISLLNTQKNFFSIFAMQDESQDFLKRQQLRELAMLNSNFREESPQPPGTVSPFTSNGMKRAKTGQ